MKCNVLTEEQYSVSVLSKRRNRPHSPARINMLKIKHVCVLVAVAMLRSSNNPITR